MFSMRVHYIAICAPRFAYLLSTYLYVIFMSVFAPPDGVVLEKATKPHWPCGNHARGPDLRRGAGIEQC